jgi:Zn-finger nucleic acid-binding protein
MKKPRSLLREKEPSPREPGVLQCPVCSRTMEIRTIYEAAIDLCPTHGVWLDRGELATIVGRVGRIHAKAREKGVAEARATGKIMGWLLGPLSFLFR